MADHPPLPTIGERIRQLRFQQTPAMTQRELAERAGVSVDLISKLEQGAKQTALLTSLHKIARALDVDVAVLLSRPQRIDVRENPDGGVLAIRRAITAQDADGEPASLEDLERSASYARSAFVHSKYDVLAGLFPELITTARTTMQATQTAEVCAVTSEVYTTAATMLTLLGHVDLGFIAMERAIAAADRADDPLRRAAASGAMSWLLLHMAGSADQAMRLAVAEADQIEPRLTTAPAGEVAVWGGLLVDAAVAAARADQPAEADDLLNLAETAATRLQADAHRGRTFKSFYNRPRFGLPMVVMQQADGAVVTGRPGRALTVAAKIAPEALPLDWRVRHLADIASAQTSLGKHDAATETLLGIEQMSPEWMRYTAYPRTIVRELLGRERRSRGRLRALAARLNVA